MSNKETDDSKKITFKFCSECSNMLYPREDREKRELFFSCRTCQHREAPSSACIYRNELANSVGETAGITQDVGQDPTVCAASASADLLSLFPEICTVCGQEILCVTCARPIPSACWLEVADSNSETEVPDEAAVPYTTSYADGDADMDALRFQDFAHDYEIDFMSDPPSDDDHGYLYVVDDERTIEKLAGLTVNADNQRSQQERPREQDQRG